MEYISAIIALAAIAVTLLSIKWDMYKQNTNNEKKRIKKKINVMLFFIILSCLGILIYRDRSQKAKSIEQQKKSIAELENQQKDYEAEWAKQRKEYADKFIKDYNEAKFEFQNQNYIAAARKYDSMLDDIMDEDLSFEINRHIGYCYFFQALFKPSDKKDLYFNNAVSVIKKILSSDNELSYNQEFNAKYDLAIIYIFYDFELFYDELQDIIKQLENDIIQNRDIPCALYEGYYLLGMYYEHEYYMKFQNEDLDKTIAYYEYALDSETDIDDDSMIGRYMQYLFKEKVAYCYLRHAAYLIVEQNVSNDSMFFKQSLNKAISIYDELLTLCNTEKGMAVYYKSLKDQARCYYLLNEPDKAYDNFIKFIYVDNKDLDYLLTGCYTFANLDLTQQDQEILLERYNRLVKSYSGRSDMGNMCDTKFEQVACYYFLSQRTGDEAYFKEGKKILNELKGKYAGYLNARRDEDLKRYDILYKQMPEAN